MKFALKKARELRCHHRKKMVIGQRGIAQNSSPANAGSAVSAVLREIEKGYWEEKRGCRTLLILDANWHSSSWMEAKMGVTYRVSNIYEP